MASASGETVPPPPISVPIAIEPSAAGGGRRRAGIAEIADHDGKGRIEGARRREVPAVKGRIVGRLDDGARAEGPVTSRPNEGRGRRLLADRFRQS